MAAGNGNTQVNSSKLNVNVPSLSILNFNTEIFIFTANVYRLQISVVPLLDYKSSVSISSFLSVDRQLFELKCETFCFLVLC